MKVTETCRDINCLIPSAQEACNLFLQECKKQGLNVLITETYRSQERQNYLYSLGRTVSGNKVTWTKNSRHTSKRAWDICKNVKGEEYTDKTFFNKCGEIAKALNITWGGSWSTPDLPHFEITEDWVNPKGLEAMTEAEKKKFNSLVETVERLQHEVDTLKNPMIYNYMDDNMPDFAKPTIQKLLNKDLLKGDENGKLHLTYDMIRLLVILDRNKLF